MTPVSLRRVQPWCCRKAAGDWPSRAYHVCRAGFASRGTAVARVGGGTLSGPLRDPKKSWVALLAFTRADAVLEELALHRVSREPERGDEVRARGLVAPGPELQLAERGVVERVAGQAFGTV